MKTVGAWWSAERVQDRETHRDRDRERESLQDRAFDLTIKHLTMKKQKYIKWRLLSQWKCRHPNDKNHLKLKRNFNYKIKWEPNIDTDIWEIFEKLESDLSAYT